MESIQPTMAPAIAAGIVQVMANVKKLAKADTNGFEHYDYASIDAFLEAMGPICAAAQIFITAEEEDIEVMSVEKADKSRQKSQLRIRWAFTIGHSSGVTFGPLHRTVIVEGAGAQAFGSAQSYAQKQFMRSIFQIPTGDKDDPDSQAKEDLPPTRSRAKTIPASAVSAKRAEAWQAIEEATKPSELLTIAGKVRDAKSFPDETKAELIARAGEGMWGFAQKTIKAVADAAGCDKAAAFYAGCWILDDSQRKQLADSFAMIREGMAAPT